MLRPLAFFHRVPVAFVPSAQAFLLLRQPSPISLYARVRNLRQSGVLALRSGIDAETGGSRFRGNTHVKLAGLAFASERRTELQVHLRAIRSFVLGKTDIAIDARQIRA